MSSKDESVFSKESLVRTKSGKEIIKQALLQSKGYRQFDKYKQATEAHFHLFEHRFLLSLRKAIDSDDKPQSTMRRFVEEVGSSELMPKEDLQIIRSRLSSPDSLADRVRRILNSNFVKMTFPVFNALFDGASAYFNDRDISPEKRTAVIDGHIIAIDLSEPMDRIIDGDEDVEFLEDYKFMCPYILEIAREKISLGGEAVLRAFEEGFKDARRGQYVDIKLKQSPESISDEEMTECYKKYRAVMGTAGRNMALNRRPLSDIFALGMAKAGECVGCGNEIEDAIKNGSIKIPSWPLFYALNTDGNIRKGFELTMEKSAVYLEEAKLALKMLPEGFELKSFLEFLFLTVSHYNQFWYNELLSQESVFGRFKERLDASLKGNHHYS